MVKKFWYAVGLCALVAGTTRAATITYNFNDGTSDGLVFSHLPNGATPFSISFAGGKAQFSEAAGGGDAQASLVTPFNITGDFTATVVADRTGIGQSELVFGFGTPTLDPAPDGLADIFFVETSHLASHILVSNFTGPEVSNSSTSLKFEIQRTGNTITTYYDSDNGFELYSQTDASLAAPGPIYLQLFEELEDSGFHTASFDDLTITGPSITPEPSSLVLLSACGLLMRRRGRRSNQ